LRVSSLDQNEVRQLEGLALDKTSTDKASGKDVKKRPQLEPNVILSKRYLDDKCSMGLEMEVTDF
jgi:hypothetical protein